MKPVRDTMTRSKAHGDKQTETSVIKPYNQSLCPLLDYHIMLLVILEVQPLHPLLHVLGSNHALLQGETVVEGCPLDPLDLG